MRLVSRSDFDGLACAAILSHLGLIDDWKFVHPKDIQDGLVEITDNDILANVPYHKGCKLWFDHHSSESERLGKNTFFEGVSRHTPSCARLIYEYYGGEDKLGRFEMMVSHVDRVDSGKLTRDEVYNPRGWILLGFIMDPRTGLGRFRDFTVSNYDLMKMLAKACEEKDIDEILAIPDVKERLNLYFEHAPFFQKMLLEKGQVHGNTVLFDLRNTDPIYAGNRFLMYRLFPDQNMSMWVVNGKNNQNCVITVGYSIFNKSATVDVGSLMLSYGGGGHHQVGTCQVPLSDADKVIKEILDKCK